MINMKYTIEMPVKTVPLSLLTVGEYFCLDNGDIYMVTDGGSATKTNSILLRNGFQYKHDNIRQVCKIKPLGDEILFEYTK